MTSSKAAKKKREGVLLLSDGSVWRGYAFGAKTSLEGEAVFHTGHTGYQEILTDPSYRKQILVFTESQLGNQGFHEDDYESEKIWASGLICRDYSDNPYHWRKEASLSDVLEKNSVPGLYGVDTRRLVLHLRSQGNLWGIISTDLSEVSKLKKILKKSASMQGLSLTQEVTTKVVYPWNKHSSDLIINRKASSAGKRSGLKRCVVIDYGVKKQILRYLVDAGFEEVLVVPASTTADQVKELKPDAVLLSNGPGDPAADPKIIQEVKKMIGEFPIFGICLGHQILGLALGCETFKLKFGHHGANHPVKNLIKNKVEITSQNHGFAVKAENIQKDIEITHINLNDETIAGFRHKKYPIQAIQFHPEAGPGPLDSREIFESFQRGFAA